VTTAALELAFRTASGRIIAALAARFRNLDVAEDAFAEACARAAKTWPVDGAPHDAAAWLYRVAVRAALDALRRQQTRERLTPDVPPPAATAEELLMHDERIVPDERLRLMFICCHPAVAPDARAALTLRMVCGLSVPEIARAFLVSEPTLAQRLVRAKHKIAAAGVPFELPRPESWGERLDAVLSTLEVAYAKAHEDAAGAGPHAGYAGEVMQLSRLLTALIADAGEAFATAATVHYAEARRPARVDAEGLMAPLSEQDPALWRRELVAMGDAFLERATELAPQHHRTIQAALQAAWCARSSLREPPPWTPILELYDELLLVRDDPIVRLNRAVAVAEVAGPAAALAEVEALDGERLANFAPYYAVRADLLARCGRRAEARQDYRALLALDPGPAERRWLERKLGELE